MTTTDTATIYDAESGREIATGLPPASVSNQAMRTASRIAIERGRPVRLEHPDEEPIEVSASGYYQDYTRSGMRDLTDAGANEARRRGLDVDSDAYGCAYAREPESGEVIDLDGL